MPLVLFKSNQVSLVVTTGLLVLQDDKLILCTTTLDRRNYWAELAQTLHGTPKAEMGTLSSKLLAYVKTRPRGRPTMRPNGLKAKSMKKGGKYDWQL